MVKLLFVLVMFPLLCFSSIFRIIGNPSRLTLDSAIAGQDPNPDRDDATCYTIRVDRSGAKITASLRSLLPEHTKLIVEFEAPKGAVSAGPVELDQTEKVLVSGIKKGLYPNLQITYTFSGSVEAGEIPKSNQNIVYKLIDNG